MSHCRGLVCLVGQISGQGCPGNGACPIDRLVELGVLSLPAERLRVGDGLSIVRHEYAGAIGRIVVGPQGEFWRISGFIDKPAVILRGIEGREAVQHVEVMGSETAKRFQLLGGCRA